MIALLNLVIKTPGRRVAADVSEEERKREK